MKKKVFCLYRVSTQKQVDKNDSDDNSEKYHIPLQKKACRGFIDTKPDWEFYDELSELGVSGYKVSAKHRDAITKIQQAALDGKFQVLLVFMFDRLGRIDDETPFIVEWFVKHGIEVWSVNEGEQRFDNHVDKLTNYIRFWQASGESEKTSIRTKERLSQIVKEGHFRGGTAPYGYRLEKRGRKNKKGNDLYDIFIDEEEARIVKHIFDLFITKGYGAHRIASFLTEKGIMTRRGDNFTGSTINHMVSNIAYTGVLRSGDTVSDIFDDLQIITPEIYEAAQQIKMQRSNARKTKKEVPLTTNGTSLLSGFVYCATCGARLVATTGKRKRTRKDGTVLISQRKSYVCYNKTRHKHKCDGQAWYTREKLDSIVDEVATNLFSHITDIPKMQIIEARYNDSHSEKLTELKEAKRNVSTLSTDVKNLEAEVIKAIRGESDFDSCLLNRLYEDAKHNLDIAIARVGRIEESTGDIKTQQEELSKQFDMITSWADMYKTCDDETKKMILSQIFESVNVKRGYEVEINLTDSFKEFGITIEDRNNKAQKYSAA